MQRNNQIGIYQIGLIVAFIGLLCLTLLVPPLALPARAQGSWSYTFDFRNNDYGFVAVSGPDWVAATWTNGVGFVASGVDASHRTAIITRSFASTTFTDVSLTVSTASQTGGTAGAAASIDSTNIINQANPPAGESTYNWNGSQAGTSLTAGINSDDSPSAQVVVISITVQGTGSDPFAPTPTPTATVPPVPTDTSGSNPWPDCPLLGSADTARFSNLPGLWILSSAANPSGSSEGLQIDNGHADMLLSLSRVRQYKIEVVAHVTDNWHEGLFRVKLGSSAWTQFRLQAEPGHQNFTLPPANYMPDRIEAGSELFTLSVIRNWAEDPTPDIEEQADQSVIVDWVCITDLTSDPNSNDPNAAPNGLSGLMDNIFGKANVGACPEESATGTGELLADVSRSLSFMWNCALRSAIGGIDKMGMDTMQFLSFFRLWFSLLTNGVIDGTGGSALAFADWLGSLFNNTETAMSNAIIGALQTAGIVTTDGSTTPFEGTLGVLNQVATTSVNDLTDIWGLLGSIFNLVTTQVVVWFQETFSSIGSLWTSANDAINHDPIPIPGIPVCDDGSDTIPEACLPIFMIDNTILGDSSILGALLPIAKGAVGFGLVWWAVSYIRGQVTGAAEDET